LEKKPKRKFFFIEGPVTRRGRAVDPPNIGHVTHGRYKINAPKKRINSYAMVKNDLLYRYLILKRSADIMTVKSYSRSRLISQPLSDIPFAHLDKSYAGR
jgi:hypothetical protein